MLIHRGHDQPHRPPNYSSGTAPPPPCGPDHGSPPPRPAPARRPSYLPPRSPPARHPAPTRRPSTAHTHRRPWPHHRCSPRSRRQGRRTARVHGSAADPPRQQTPQHPPTKTNLSKTATPQPNTAVAPRPGTWVIPRRPTGSDRSLVGRTVQLSNNVLSTMRISYSANAAPRQRRTPPPKGIQV